MKTIKMRVIKTAIRSGGSGIQESFWEVQKKELFGWRTVATFGNSTAALIHAKEELSK